MSDPIQLDLGFESRRWPVTNSIHTYRVVYVTNRNSSKLYAYQSRLLYEVGDFVIVNGQLCCIQECLYNTRGLTPNWIQGPADLTVPEINSYAKHHMAFARREAAQRIRRKLMAESNVLSKEINARREAVRMSILDKALADDNEYQDMIARRAELDRQIGELRDAN